MLDKWQEILETLNRNKLRSFFTGFGVFWGIFMLIILLGLGSSFEGGALKSIDGFATNSCFFWTGRTSKPYKGFGTGRFWTMNNKDITQIKQKASALEYISPILFVNSFNKNVVNGQKTSTSDIRGVYPEHFDIERQDVLFGRLFNDRDDKTERKSCIIGKKVYETLFSETEDPIGKYIRVNGIYLQVVGVIRPKSHASISGDVENSVFIPFSTTQRLFGIGDVIYFIACTAKPGYDCATLEEQVTNILKANHDIAPDDTKGVGSVNVEKQFLTFSNFFLGVEALVWIVGIGSLLSGIIGIMNIMLVTVRERTREIGVRRALGASPRNILTQIMSESLLLTALAGFSGLFCGMILLEIVRAIMTMGPPEDSFFVPPFISISKAIIALSILCASGLLAGLLPAYRALQIKAIDAIRDE
ncbi:putative ABC transport system permease protein [Dysgonomonas sp. PH5-45]|uniref:ABC transporter permease n=1 Tax=unclassified Dysgonomonas TaxID=2630389 RepID=UPI0024751CE3|nr:MULTISPECIES: ABC transporter permease [unclassified Dysgonomonas]MDH6355596.1 putative ABC transport system permease protein [Dysgonomonas sp. PH5-45]MDH6388494.1 putative ABC transport system permease protein [Dysgonomonas sp. PH5-37]